MFRFITFFVISGILVFNTLANDIPITIIHTNDLHSHAEGVGPYAYPSNGHYARLLKKIDSIRSETIVTSDNPQGIVITVDAGDFFSGTLFSQFAMLSEVRSFPEWDFFHTAKYDAVSLGNHEFDGGEEGLSRMLNKILNYPSIIPLLGSNIKNFSNIKISGKNALYEYYVKTFTVNDKTIKVGFLGGLSPDAIRLSISNRNIFQFYGHNERENRVKIKELADHLNSTITHLKEQQGVDLIIMVYHGGEPEDTYLAQQVPDLDIIISGHTHQSYPRPIQVGKTVINQAGEYGEELGVLKFNYQNNSLKLINPDESNNIPITSKDDFNSLFYNEIEKYKKQLSILFSKEGYQYDTKIFTATNDLQREYLKEIIPNGILRQLNDKEKNYVENPVDIYFTALGLIRDNIHLINNDPTDYLFADIFRILGTGFDRNLQVGNDISHFYLTRFEVKLLIEFLEYYSKLSISSTPAFSSTISYEIRKWGIPFINKVKNIQLHEKNYYSWPKLIHVATNTYISNALKEIPNITRGPIKFTPKNVKGEKLDDFPIYDNIPKEFLLFSNFLKTNYNI